MKISGVNAENLINFRGKERLERRRVDRRREKRERKIRTSFVQFTMKPKTFFRDDHQAKMSRHTSEMLRQDTGRSALARHTSLTTTSLCGRSVSAIAKYQHTHLSLPYRHHHLLLRHQESSNKDKNPLLVGVLLL